MTAIAGACAVGFGTRSWTGAPEHLAALEMALDHGCSLIDAAWPRVAHHVEPVVGRALAHRLDDVVVVAGTDDVDEGSLVRKVRVCAGRLRRDRLDVLVLDDPARVLAGLGGERRFQQAVEVLESLADRGELGCYGLRLGRASLGGEPAGGGLAGGGLAGGESAGGELAARTVGRCLDLARQVRAGHRMSVLQAPCQVLRPDVRTQVPDLLAVARASRLSTVGTRPLPLWPVSGVAPMATCQRYLLEGLDHVVLDLRTPAQVRAVAALLPGGAHRAGRPGSRRAC